MVSKFCTAPNLAFNPDIRQQQESLYEWRLRQMNFKSATDTERAHFIRDLADQAYGHDDPARQVRLLGICTDLADYLSRNLFDGTVDPSEATDLFVDILTEHYEAAQRR